MFSTFLCFLLFVYFAYKYLTSNYNYWKKKNVPFETPTLFFGSIKDVFLIRKNFADFTRDMYNQYPDSPYVGFYNLRNPSLLIKNPDDIEQVFLRDLDFFGKNEFNVDLDVDPISARSPFFLWGQKWKMSRTVLRPIFSSAKMKHVTPFLVQATNRMIKYIENLKVCEARDLSIRYVADASALSAFGVDGESFDNDDAFFRKLGQKLMEPDNLTGLKLMCMVYFPKLAKFLKLKFIPDESAEYLKQTIATSLKHRKENNIANNDFLDALVALKGDTFTDLDLIGWAFGFFSEPNSSNQASYVLYALAKNQEVQKKLKAEIDDVLKRFNGEITYEAIQDMTYLDCVVSETLRLYPSVQMSMKRCTGYYEFPLKEGQSEVVSLEPGMSLAISISGLHQDDRYFKNAKEFVPERFLNKEKIPIGAYIPFGIGKRICLGMKFALILMKVSTVAIVNNFHLTLNEKTTEPLQLDPKYVIAVTKSGLWINFNKRN